MVLQVATVLGASAGLALPAATVVEFVIGALDVIDDVVDDELDAQFSMSRSLNGTLALLALADVATQRLSQDLPFSQLALFRSAISRGLVEATKGEDLDILYEDRAMVDEQAALCMTAQKSGSLVAMVLQLAGALATDNLGILNSLAEFGTHVGTIAQLQNDAQACTLNGAIECSDLRRRKKTVPITYALQCAQTDGNFDFQLYFSVPADSRPPIRLSELQRYIAECGALHYTWVVSEGVRQRAEASLIDLSRLVGSEVANGLRNLIPPLPVMLVLS